MAKKYWIMKVEPSDLSIDVFERDKIELWDAVRNYQVRNMFRDEMKVGDRAFFYQSNSKEIGIVGEMEVSQTAIADPLQFDAKSNYYDPKSTVENPRWLAPTVTFVKKFEEIITLAELKTNELFSDLPIVRKGNRLSVTQITKVQYDNIIKLSKQKGKNSDSI